MSDNLQHLKNNNGILLIDKYDEVKEYLECEIFKEGCGFQEPYGDDSVILSQRLTKELALKGAKALKDLGYQVNICCEAGVSNNDELKYILVYAGDENELKEATEYTLENGRFFLVGNLQHSGIDNNQILRFYDKDDELKMIHFTTSSQFHNAEIIAREILSNNESFAYATADFKGDIAAIARIDDDEIKMRINKQLRRM